MLMTSVYHIRSSPGAGSGETHKLVFTTTSLRNAVLANASDVLYYEVVTPAWERHRTRVTRLDVKTQEFALVAEMLNGHAPGDTRGREDEAKRAMALRMYGGGEYKAVHDFLHFEDVLERGGAGDGDARTGSGGKDRKGKARMKDEGEEEMSGFFVFCPVWLVVHMLMGPQRQAWFRGKDGKRYIWYADKERVELLRDDRPDKPVAAYHKEERLLHVLRMSQYPYLEVDRDPTIIESLDYVIDEMSSSSQ
ncbi:hypothetical protein GSI_07399 [Ganoderma sinense ZZ0214-1]|uniref:DUF6593 domain-containing protein n=1 Tax=Ganoderma sinense ZZ0214-1 TaxID=1077348 RepID=A0A2G8SAA8_9APHY|nr:hypothetical protein GSI_07399 [Ganoderma sinense ZZ0214-1]